MDFGFGAFLEKFEEHFGKWAIKMLLVLIGLAVALFCCKLIWDIALGPLTALVTGALATGDIVQTILQIFWRGVAFVAGIAAAVQMSASFAAWRNYKQGQASLQRTMQLEAKLTEKMPKVEDLTDQASIALKSARLLLDEAIIVSKEAEALASRVKDEASKPRLAPTSENS